MVDVTGYWRYREEFDFGNKTGEVRLIQDGARISGSLFFNEKSEGQDVFFVRVSITGEVRNNEIILNDLVWTVLVGGTHEDYLPEERIGILNEKGQIVGSVFDQGSIGGVFVMDKLP